MYSLRLYNSFSVPQVTTQLEFANDRGLNKLEVNKKSGLSHVIVAHKIWFAKRFNALSEYGRPNEVHIEYYLC